MNNVFLVIRIIHTVYAKKTKEDSLFDRPPIMQ